MSLNGCRVVGVSKSFGNSAKSHWISIFLVIGMLFCNRSFTTIAQISLASLVIIGPLLIIEKSCFLELDFALAYVFSKWLLLGRSLIFLPIQVNS